MQLSVLIKTYNEERKLPACLDSVVAAIKDFGTAAEIIVADSLSSDSTVQIAQSYSVGTVQIHGSEKRGCGTGVQLGFQHAQGEFVLFLDGDMELQPNFLSAGIELLRADNGLAGVAGLLSDVTEVNWFDRNRTVKKPSATPGEQPWLNGGGLYRRQAIEDAGGYAGNRNLVAYEEAELGLRLTSRGWKLLRLPIPYVKHTGHPLSTMGVVRRMWTSGRMAAGGVLLRSAVGKPWFPRVARMFAAPLAVTGMWLIMLSSLLNGWYTVSVGMIGVFAITIAAQALRRKNLGDALFSFMLWHLSAAGLLKGFFRKRISPVTPIRSVVLAEPRPIANSQATRR